MSGEEGMIIFCDYSKIECELEDKIQEELLKQEKPDPSINLGIFRNWKFNNGDLWTAQFVGAQYLKKSANEYFKNDKDEMVPLIIKPRFADNMLFYILDKVFADEEIDIYLQARSKENKGESQLFYIFDKEPLIEVRKKDAQNFIIFIAIAYINTLYKLCQRTIKYQFIKKEENLTGKIKGKIVFKHHIRENLVRGREDRIFCQFSELNINCLENQILKAALECTKIYLREYDKLLQNSDLINKIAFCTMVLKPVELKKINPNDFKGLKFNGIFKNYKEAIRYAKIILKNVPAVHHQESENMVKIPQYYIDVQMLFEFYLRALVRDILKEADTLKGWKLRRYVAYEEREKEKDLRVFIENKENSRFFLSKYLLPDIMLEFETVKDNQAQETDNNKNKRSSIILDAKYRSQKSLETGRREITHQLLAYGYLFDAIGLGLVLPKADAEDEDILRETKLNNSSQNPYAEVSIDLHDSSSYEKNKENLRRVLKYLLNGGQ